jgi:hypothetical protein
MLRDSSGSAHLLAAALRALQHNINQRQTPFTLTTEDSDCRQPARDCFDECLSPCKHQLRITSGCRFSSTWDI